MNDPVPLSSASLRTGTGTGSGQTDENRNGGRPIPYYRSCVENYVILQITFANFRDRPKE
jgi:hypothetical protein